MYDDEQRREEEQEMEEDRRRMTGPPPAFCHTEDEYLDWRRGYVTESELRARHSLGGR